MTSYPARAAACTGQKKGTGAKPQRVSGGMVDIFCKQRQTPGPASRRKPPPSASSGRGFSGRTANANTGAAALTAAPASMPLTDSTSTVTARTNVSTAVLPAWAEINFQPITGIDMKSHFSSRKKKLLKGFGRIFRAEFR